MWTEHKSKEDKSVNFSKPTSDGGMLEARFVRRSDDYFIIYISSHTGCRHACRFCHLTQTGQTMFTPATIDELKDQVDVVLEYYRKNEAPAERVNINFMARGDAMSSRILIEGFDEFAAYALARTKELGLDIQFNISTIFPLDSEDVDLVSVFAAWPVVFYWSLYSLNTRFRKRWLPRAQAPEDVSKRLRDYQVATGRDVVFHWAFIEGENDKKAQVDEIASWIEKSGIEGRFNLVRYNPHNPATGKEPDETVLANLFGRLNEVMLRPGSRIVPRVGFDVHASCGMFLEK